MQRLINRYGEFNIVENLGILKMPYSRLGKNANQSNLSQNYIKGITKFGMNDLIIYSTDLKDKGNYFEMKYDLKNKRPFIDVRNFNFAQQLALFNSIIEIGRIETEKKQPILWEKENFLFDSTTGKIRALLFEFQDFPLYIKKDSVEGVKSLLFLALTNLDKFDRKPNRTDFIDQSPKIIAFANKLLLAQSLDDIEKVVADSLEYELSLLEMKEKEKEEKESKFKKKLIPKRKKNDSEKVDYKTQLKQSLASNTTNPTTPKVDNRPFSVRMADKILTPKGFLVLGVCASVMLLLGFVYPKVSNSGNAQAKAEQEQKINDETMNAYRTYISGNKNKAYQDLDSIGYKNLKPQDQKILLKFYLDQGKYTKALETVPDYAYNIGDKLVSEGDKDDLEKIAIATDNKVLDFDLAFMNQEYQSVVNLSGNLKQINERRANDIVKAYYLTNQDTELQAFIKKKEDEEAKHDSKNLSNEITALTTVQQDFYNDYTTYRSLDKKYNNLLSQYNNAKQTNNNSAALSLQTKLNDAKSKRDEAYKQIQQKYTPVTFIK